MAEWDDKTRERLRVLWNSTEPHYSTKQIGDMLGFSKNAIVGVAHRMRLSSRPSPIRRGGEPAVRKPKREMPQLVSAEDMKLAASVQQAQIVPLPSVKRNTVSRGASRPCAWPFGTPRTPEFRYCEDASKPGRPYCEAHCEAAYINWRGAA